MSRDTQIDFRQIVAKYSFAEHAERADRYFGSIGMDAPVARKPFAAAHEAVELSSGVAAVLSGLNLFHGAQVLDYGAGTCWLSRILALLGCEVTAADVSANALRIGERIITSDPLSAHLQVSFSVISEPRLPFADGSFDRVVVFDAFHHCPDQMALVGEFHRVLRSGGIAAFHEPGPRHSKTTQSQYEMRTFDVIEGDIVVEDLLAQARRVGFSTAELAVFAARPVMVELGGFDELLSSPDGGATGRALVDRVRNESDNRRVFFLHKDGASAMDSRSPMGLRAELQLDAELVERGIRLHGQAVNAGSTTWLPSVSGRIGSVNVGVHLYGDGGALLDNDHARLALSQDPVPSGTSLEVDGIIPYPQDVDRFSIRVDLVSEGVAWFEILGSTPIGFEVDRGRGRISRV